MFRACERASGNPENDQPKAALGRVFRLQLERSNLRINFEN